MRPSPRVRSRRAAVLGGLALLTFAASPAAADLASRVFAGSWGPAGAGLGRVHRYETGTTWTEITPPGGLGDAVWDLEWHDDALWAVTHEGDAASLVPQPERPDTPHGFRGRVFRFDGAGWTEHSPVGGFSSAATTVSSMGGRLYATVDRDGLYRWEGGRSWTLLGDFVMGAQAIVSRSHDGLTDMLYLGQDNTDEFWVHDPTGSFPCGDWMADPGSIRTDCQEPAGGLVCSADCWPGSCIHAFTEFDAGAGPLVHAGAWLRQMYRWDPTTRLFARIDEVPDAPTNGQPQHVQGLASWRNRLWVGISDGRLWSSPDARMSTYLLEEEFGAEWAVSEMTVAASDDLLWVGFGGVPWRWARTEGRSRIWTSDGADWVERGLPDAFGDGVLVLLPVDPEVACDAGPDQVVECGGGRTAVTLDGTGSQVPPPALALDATWTWSGDFVEGVADGPMPTVHFAGPGDHVVTLTVSAGATSATCETLVRVVDTRPPVLEAAGACLWPPNHRYRCFEVSELVVGGVTGALDACEGDVAVRIVDAWSAQPEDDVPLGDGRTEDDLLFDDLRACARAERQGADPAGRDYTIVLAATDASGNETRVEAVLHVPHDQRPPERCPPRPVDPGLRPNEPLPLPPDASEGRYPDASRPPR